jgi:hypothetical protein
VRTTWGANHSEGGATAAPSAGTSEIVEEKGRKSMIQRVRNYLPWLVGWAAFGVGQAIAPVTLSLLVLKVSILSLSRVLP